MVLLVIMLNEHIKLTVLQWIQNSFVGFIVLEHEGLELLSWITALEINIFGQMTVCRNSLLLQKLYSQNKLNTADLLILLAPVW